MECAGRLEGLAAMTVSMAIGRAGSDLEYGTIFSIRKTGNLYHIP
jgi:hypothetical protein